MSIQQPVSLLLIAGGVALCAAFGGQLPEATRQRESLRAQQRYLSSHEQADPAQVSALSLKLKEAPPQLPSARLSEWLSSSALPFGLGCLLIITGSMIARRREGDVRSEDEGAAEGEVIDFGALLSRASGEVSSLYEEAQQLSGGALSETAVIRERIKELQRGDLERLVEARAKVRARYGVTAFAELFGSISQGERRLNRAWSALVDQHVPESLSALRGAQSALQEAEERLRSLG